MVSCEYIIVSVCCPSHTGGAGGGRKLAQHNHTLYQILALLVTTTLLTVSIVMNINDIIFCMLSAVAMLPRGEDQLSYREVV